MQKNLLLPTYLLLVLAGTALGQDTSWVKVIFYDYRADSSSPNFQNCNPGRLIKGLVNPVLGPDRKPLLNTNVTCLATADTCPLSSCHNRLNEWFRPSSTNGPDPDVQFVYDSLRREWRWQGMVNYQNRSTEWVGPNFNAADPMANIVIYDSLPFIASTIAGTPRGTVEFFSDAFFRLNNRGFGNDFSLSNNNYGFAMELHTEFVYVGGEFFSFSGDDDVWAFVDGKLVIDLGGTHAPETGNFSMDSLATVYGFQKGKKYAFDFFYCERHTWSSKIRISTNLLKPPSFIHLRVAGDSTLAAGSNLSITGEVYNIDGVLDSAFSSQVTWSIVGTQEPGDALSTSVGQTTSLSATKAHRTIQVKAQYIYTDPTSGVSFPVESYINIYVKAGFASNVWIERLLGDTAIVDSNVATTEDRFYISVSQAGTVAHAVLRDRYGNFVRFANAAIWTSLAPDMVSVVPQSTARWNGLISKGAGTSLVDSTRIVVVQSGTTADTAWVVAQFSLVAPSIVQALLYLGTPPGVTVSSGSAPRDTLVVTFSAPVSCDDLADFALAFAYLGADSDLVKSSATLDLASVVCSVGTTTRAVYLADAGAIVPYIDSLRIRSVRDAYGHLADAEAAQVIELGRDYAPAVRVVDNPFSPAGTVIPAPIISGIDMTRVPTGTAGPPSHGTAIRVETATVEGVDLAKTSAVLYDAVGNRLSDDLPAYPATNGRAYYFFWDGRNRASRIVGSGTYLALVKIAAADRSGARIARVKIGVEN